MLADLNMTYIYKKNEISILGITLLIAFSLISAVHAWTYRADIINISSNNKKKINQLEKVSVPNGLFSYGGSTSWIPIKNLAQQKIKTVFPRYKLRYTIPATGYPGSGVGIKMLLNDELSFSLSSRSIKEKEYQKAQKKGFKLTGIPVAIDGIAVAVHPKLNVPGLTIEQLRDIYTGKVTNWKQLGGQDIKIMPYSKKTQGGTVEFFKKNVLNQEDFGDIQKVKTTTEALTKVSSHIGGIFYASAPEVVEQCSIKTLPIGRSMSKLIPPYQEPFVPLSQCPQKRNQLNLKAFKNDEYPMTRRLFVIVKNNDRVGEQAGLAYANFLLTQEGQRLISDAGFVRIR